MERRPELPWTDWEKLDLFCEIIKSSHLSPDDLFRIIQAHRISPVWENTALPRGRSLQECRRQFDAYQKSHPYVPRTSLSAGPAQYPSGPLSYRSGPIDPHPFDASRGHGRLLLPKAAPSTPSEGAPVFPSSPMSEQPPVKKRGRPPKEEVTRRKAEAESRGEVYPPPRGKRAKRDSAPALIGSSGLAAGRTTPQLQPVQTILPTAPPISTPTGPPPPADTGSDSSGSKRRRQRGEPPTPIGIATMRTQPSSSYESPPATGLTLGQPSASTMSSTGDPEVRVERTEESAAPPPPPPATRGQSYRDIVGIEPSSSRLPDKRQGKH